MQYPFGTGAKNKQRQQQGKEEQDGRGIILYGMAMMIDGCQATQLGRQPLLAELQKQLRRELSERE